MTNCISLFSLRSPMGVRRSKTPLVVHEKSLDRERAAMPLNVTSGASWSPRKSSLVYDHDSDRCGAEYEGSAHGDDLFIIPSALTPMHFASRPRGFVSAVSTEEMDRARSGENNGDGNICGAEVKAAAQLALRQRRSRRSCRQAPLTASERVTETFRSGQWLTDASIATVFSDLESRLASQQPTGTPDPVLFMDPAIAFWFAMDGGDLEDRREALVGLQIEERNLIICPVNDSRAAFNTDSGSHWSLLVCVRLPPHRGGGFLCLHYDSARGTSRRSQRQAQRIVRNIHDSPDIRIYSARCSQQVNSFDCGAYVLLFSELIATAFLDALRQGKPVHKPTMWESSLQTVTPSDVTAYRLKCRRDMARRSAAKPSNATKCEEVARL